ncbi:hypothetical protein HPG69_016882 [Diceros bicornis minor]|uniref:Uncharacterized protein n=1 Tax=Diceros bicornis minor TaxID=77932 RepID=A0A7J7ECX8_DICBM|nr:hypothetical protein HPG69_016882 [Diceros bicornis minor]
MEDNLYPELPKTELIANLNGSIGSNTIIAKKPDLQVHNRMTMIDKGKQRTPEDSLVVTKDVIKEFTDDGCQAPETKEHTQNRKCYGND